jgi:hypothetical protein
MGSKRDFARRLKLSRFDNEYQQYDIEKARQWIYSKGIKIGSTAIQNLLGSKSLTPTRVSNKI